MYELGHNPLLFSLQMIQACPSGGFYLFSKPYLLSTCAQNGGYNIIKGGVVGLNGDYKPTSTFGYFDLSSLNICSHVQIGLLSNMNIKTCSHVHTPIGCEHEHILNMSIKGGSDAVHSTF